MPRVLALGRLKPSLAEELERTYGLEKLPAGAERAEWLRTRGDWPEVLVSSGMTPVDADLLAAVPNVRAIVNFGVGYDHIDLAAVRERGIVASNTPGVLDDCVADTAVALVLDVMRGFSASDRWVRAGRWPVDGPTGLTRRVSGCRVGVLGLGRIGVAIARRLAAFDCRISYHNRHRRTDVEYAYAESPAALAAEVDVLVVAAAGGSGTAHLVDREVLTALGPRGYLVNIARGSVVDEEALVELLRSGALAGAGLDVFAREPKLPEELFALDSVVLLPHIGSATVETREAMADLVVRNLAQWVADGTVRTPIP
ncbi:2-hydroxyacid dehydrogenase [Pseudonocardia xishanensis]|uniref:2-hydroxyacid dehydrogenase n=1 Tax=Pseudonocardia xishanensis TaxID=630995 RepID=A0ABP8RI13_9PSEU